MANNNGHNKPGRPSLRKGEPSDPITVRLPRSQYERTCRLAKAHNTTPPAFLRDAQEMVAQQQVVIEQLLLERYQTTTNEQRANAFMRLLSARSEFPKDTIATLKRFLERWPDDACAYAVYKSLEYLQAQPSMSDADQWQLVQHGRAKV